MGRKTWRAPSSAVARRPLHHKSPLPSPPVDPFPLRLPRKKKQRKNSALIYSVLVIPYRLSPICNSLGLVRTLYRLHPSTNSRVDWTDLLIPLVPKPKKAFHHFPFVECCASCIYVVNHIIIVFPHPPGFSSASSLSLSLCGTTSLNMVIRFGAIPPNISFLLRLIGWPCALLLLLLHGDMSVYMAKKGWDDAGVVHHTWSGSLPASRASRVQYLLCASSLYIQRVIIHQAGLEPYRSGCLYVYRCILYMCLLCKTILVFSLSLG